MRVNLPIFMHDMGVFSSMELKTPMSLPLFPFIIFKLQSANLKIMYKSNGGEMGAFSFKGIGGMQTCFHFQV